MIIRNDAIHLISFALRDGRRMTDVSLNRPLTVFYFNHFYYWQESGYTNKLLFLFQVNLPLLKHSLSI